MLRDDWPLYVLTAAEMRALERAAIESGAVTGLELMERAGRGVVEAILAEWPDIEAGAKRAVVLCGPGNNGGNGFVVARLLNERGWAVEVFLYGDPDRLPPDARVNWARWREVGEVFAIEDSQQSWDLFYDMTRSPPGSLLIDALFGTGLARPLGEEFQDWAWWTQMSVPEAVAPGTVQYWPKSFRIAIDLPSGLDADSGRELVPLARPMQPGTLGRREEFVADLCVTFHSLKPGHILAGGPARCCKTVVADIGLDGVLPRRLSSPKADEEAPQPTLLRIPDKAARLVRGDPRALGDKAHSGNKFSHGHALILSGPATRTGAARLAARAALRVGAGLVTVGSPVDALPEHAARLDAIMLREAGAGAAVAEALADARINAVCVGPGLGLDDRAAGIVREVLGRVGFHPTDASPGEAGPHPTRRYAVLDADALTLLARDPALFALLTPACVLTPHAGEFARLFPDIAARLAAPATTGPAYSKVDATRDAAARAGCTVLFKGPDTVIADETGRAAIHAAVYDRAAPWLATAGSGDVLAGLIAGLLARGFLPFDAACTAAWLHVECALEFGPGLIAEDLPEMIPRVFRKLGL